MTPRKPLRRRSWLTGLFACAIALALPLAVHAADPAHTTPPAQPPPPEQSANTPPAKARREDTEPETLPAALAELKKARGDRDDAETKLAAEELNHGKTKELLKTTLEAAKSAQAERDAAQQQLATVTQERDTERAAHGKTKEQLGLAEAALGVQGISAAQAVPAATQPAASEKLTAASFDQKLRAEKDPAKRKEIMAEFSKAAKEGRLEVA